MPPTRDDTLLWIVTPDGCCPDCTHPLTGHAYGGLCRLCSLFEISGIVAMGDVEGACA